MSLEDLRRRIDAIDEQILHLLGQRAETAGEIGELKRADGQPIYAPDREQVVLERIAASNPGPFPTPSAQAIYREIIATCRTLEEPARIAYLGPPGTFTDIAARRLFGHHAEYLAQSDFNGVFEAVGGGLAEAGVVPVENSTAGTIREVLDLLAGTRLTITGETYVDVHHCLLSLAEPDQIRVVYSKDTALAQCRNWLRRHLPKARLVAVASTVTGAEKAAGSRSGAAIAPEQAAGLYDLPIVARDIQDRHDNRTRFFSLGTTMPPATGHDKTSIRISVPHQPGALVTALEVVHRHQLNMTLIESRPSPQAAFEYMFFIDFEGHRDTEPVAAALDELAGVCLLTQVLGSYPRAQGW